MSPTRVIMTTINIPTTPGATATQVQWHRSRPSPKPFQPRMIKW
jgi:hypothetical protein